MSNQIVISSGAKVRSLEGVLTGTAGIVNALGINVANGIPQLDSNAKILVSQLPNSVMEYKGTWDAATNTPTLANGTGNQGDVYLCNVAGTVNFGAGAIPFAVGDQVIYSGTIWQKAGGATGTVTSVALTESGDALTITGSPITTSGTINIGFAGTGSQYIKGDGTLATFPTTIDQAKRLITEVYNSTGATLTKGTVVYINGGQGNLPTVTKAQANNDANSAQTYGVVQDDITNMNNGFVVVLGSLTDLDTSAYVVGTQLYLSGTTAGAWTSTKPSAPIHLVYVAIVVRSHPTQGVVEVRIQNGYELEEIHDVAISAPVNNQGIFYNSSNDLWENKSIATALGYTPANDALVVHLAGTETITGAKTFSSVITGDAGIILKEGVIPSLVGYTGLAGDADGLVITKRVGATAYTNLLSFTTSTSNTYSFPNLSGTIALLQGTQTFSGVKTFDAGLSLKDAVYPTPLSGYSSIGANPFGISIVTNQSSTIYRSDLGFPAAQRTYTFPNASGTIALTSNLSSYVPYTGATGNVNLGTNNLTASNLFGETSLNVKILGSGSIYSTGYSTFSTLAGKLTLAQEATAGNLKAFTFDFSAWSTNTSYTYTLPAINGTLALLEGTQTISGAKTFSASVNNDDGLKIKLGSAANLTAGYLTMSAYGETSPLPDRTILRIGTSATQLTLFKLQNTGSYTYDFPAANGYIATWSSATTNRLAKFGTNNLVDSLIWDNGTNVGIGNTNTTYTFDVTGTGRFTGALNGTSAVFSSSVTAASEFISSTGFNAKGNGSDTAGASPYYLLSNTAGNRLWAGQLGANNEYRLHYYNGSSWSNPFTINSSGNVGIGSASPYNKLTIEGSTARMDLNDGGGASRKALLIEPLGYNSNAYARIESYNYGTATGGNLAINTTGGNVGIGTPSPTAKLSIVADWVAGGATVRCYPVTSFASGGLGGYGIFDSDGTTRKGYINVSSNYMEVWCQQNSPMTFGTNDVERMRITSGGFLKASNTGSYYGATNPYHELRTSEGSNAVVEINNSSASNPYGINLSFSGADPNNTTNYVFGAYTTTPSFVWIYRIWSNGTVSARSDARWKKNIETTRDGYIDDLCKLRVVKYNWYNNEEGTPKELGLIAQEVEQVFPNLIQYDKVITKKQVEQEDGTFIEQEVEDGESRSIKTSVLPYMLLKALQEANAKIEELSAKVSALENKS